MSALIFEDTFTIKTKDQGGKKFDKVSRYYANSTSYDIELYLDVNAEVFPLEENQRVEVHVATTLNLDGSAMSDSYNSVTTDACAGKPTLADKYEYVMYGRVFKFVEDKAPSTKLSVIASFGGLLMALKGDARHLSQFEQDQNVFLLVRRV